MLALTTSPSRGARSISKPCLTRTVRCFMQDVDEFFWAPEHPRLVDYLASLPDRISEVSATELRFGSKGQVTAQCIRTLTDCTCKTVEITRQLADWRGHQETDGKAVNAAAR